MTGIKGIRAISTREQIQTLDEKTVCLALHIGPAILWMVDVDKLCYSSQQKQRVELAFSF